jgi:hypothetical protein
VARTLFPHDFLGDVTYLRVVAAIDAKSVADQGTAAVLQAALAAFPHDFTAMPETKRADYLRRRERSAFFDERIGTSLLRGILEYTPVISAIRP